MQVSIGHRPTPFSHRSLPTKRNSGRLRSNIQINSMLSVTNPSNAFILSRRDPEPIILFDNNINLAPVLDVLRHLDNRSVHPIRFLRTYRGNTIRKFHSRILTLTSQHPNVRIRFYCHGPDRTSHSHFRDRNLVDHRALRDLLPLSSCSVCLYNPELFVRTG